MVTVAEHQNEKIMMMMMMTLEMVIVKMVEIVMMMIKKITMVIVATKDVHCDCGKTRRFGRIVAENDNVIIWKKKYCFSKM